MSARELARLARRQRGLFTRADARRCGCADDQIRRRVGAGEWRIIVGPVMTVGSANLTQAHLDLAAQLAVPGSVLTGPVAARAWGMPVDDDRVMVVVKAGRRVRVPGVLVAYGSLARARSSCPTAPGSRSGTVQSSTACQSWPSAPASTCWIARCSRAG